MKTNDKVLIGIVVGIVLLVVVALMLTLLRSEPVYQVENAPEGVAHNYLLALQKGEYQRAYGYLSPTIKGYPSTADEFTRQVVENSWRFPLDAETTLAVESTRILGNSATVKVREARFEGGSLFESDPTSTVFDMDLELHNGEWKIVHATRYYAWCWSYENGCH